MLHVLNIDLFQMSHFHIANLTKKIIA